MHRSLVFVLALAACGTSAEVSAPGTPEAHREVTEIPDRLTEVVLAPEEEAPRPSPKLFSEYAEPTDVDSPFGHGGDEDGLTDSIGGLIGAKGTRVSTGGLGSGGSSGIRGGAAYGGSAEGLGGLGTKGMGSGGGGSYGAGAVGYGSSSGLVGRGGGASSPRAMVDYTPAPRQPLRAGSTDDNADFDGFLAYLDTERSHGRLGRVDSVDLRDRTTLRVLDSAGEPVPSATVKVLNDGQVVWRGETYGDGRLPYYPHQLGDAVTRVEVSHVGAKASAKWDGTTELTVALDVPADEVVRLDVGLILDTTGSMADELAAIKASLAEVTERLKADDRAVDIRFGAVLYRDHGDRYVTETHAFTDLERFESVLEGAEADGGGDMPEAMHEALEIGIDKLAWREDAARVAFVVADAPPQLHNGRPHGQSALDALSKGIRVHTVAASGLDPMGSLVMRRVAQLTRGKFIFIEYGGNLAGSASAHGVKGQLESNNLDDILYKELKAEMDGWGTWTL